MICNFPVSGVYYTEVIPTKLQQGNLDMFELLKDKCAKGRKVLFSLEGAQGRSAAVAGSFNDWEPAATPMKYDAASRTYRAIVELAPGEYEYKFVVDDEWLLDESNPNFYPNDFGTLNSVLLVD